ncbi:hypothetical protein BYT27DRAFT_7195140 [Phlegmacium glaucopus]|nr:hypothetical protein BYT27DRAFT_7195140 [Phlegmacium glaucopus]
MHRAPSPYHDRAPSPYRASSPYRAPSPYGAHSYVPPTENQFPPQPHLPSSNVQVGSTTYTTSTGPDGRTLYHHLKAVAASYQTPNGVVSGIQWVPADAPVPSVAQSEFYTNRSTGGYGYKEDKSSTQNWQHTDEKKRKQEEKEAKRLREQGLDRNDAEYELRIARERDAQSSVNRERRKSFNTGGTGPISGSASFPAIGNTGYPTHPNVATGYPPSPYSGYSNLAAPVGAPVPPHGSGNTGHIRKQSGAYTDITRQFNDLDIDGNKEYTAEHDRKAGSGGHTRKYSTNDVGERTISGNYVDRANPYPTAASGPYSNPKNAPAGQGVANPYPNYYNSSPNMRPSDISYGSASSGYSGSMYPAPSRDQAELIARSTTPFGASPPQVYPRGHVLEGQHIVVNNNNSRSRAPSPNPGNASPNMSGRSLHTEPHQLPAPEAFSRPINAANSYAPFDSMKVLDMDDLYEPKVPKMPIVLTTHDIYQDDWKRCIQDLARSWTGHLPVGGLGRDGRAPKPAALSADLINLWNVSFFGPRGVELVLYKGRERRTGPNAGQLDSELASYDGSDDSSSSSSSDSDLGDHGNHGNPAGPYGRPPMPVDTSDSRRRRHEERQERRRRRKEKKARRKAKAKGYSVYVAYLPLGNPNPYGKGMVPGGYNSTTMPNKPYGGYAPMNVPQSRSQGYGTGY